jgi:hypothetical protein
MEYQSSGLTIETFLAVAEMVAAQLRIKEADRWAPQICQLKYVSFTAEFPEVNDAQFLWSAEQWLQDTGGKDFLRYPTWKELMSPLYRSENGQANRSWGFKDSLPIQLQPSAQQLAALPPSPQSIAASPDPHNSGAYQVFTTEQWPALPAASESTGLTPRQWAAYLKQLAEEETGGASDDRGPAQGNP